MIANLQSLRFVFAVMIFFHHYTVDGAGLFYAGGACGVSFFMILSGFVMFAGYGDKVLQPDFKRKEYLLKRLIRLYPLHILCLLGFLVLNMAHLFSVKEVVKLSLNVLLLQSWIPVNSVYFSGNAVSWCLADMMFFYAMFPLLTGLLSRVGLTKICFWFIPLLMGYLFIMFLLPDVYCHPFLYISPVFRLLDFFIGMLLYSAYHKMDARGWRERMNSCSYLQKSFMEIFLFLFLSMVILTVPHLEMRYYCAALWWLIIPELILYFAFVNKVGGVISRCLTSKWMIALGEISFSMYMIHCLGISVLRSVFDKLGLTMIWQIELPVCFLTVLCVSYLIYHYYENPVSLYLKKRLI